MAEDTVDNLRVLIPRFLLLAALLLGLLFVMTKFNFIHCAQAPYPWCEMYCSVSKASKIAIIEGSDGMGDSKLMIDKLSNLKPSSPIVNFNRNEISIDAIRSYEMVILTHSKVLDFNQQKVIEEYLKEPQATLLWIGDAASIQEECPACKIRSNSIGLIYSKGDESNATSLRNELVLTNPSARIELIDADKLTIDSIKTFDVIIYESFVSLNKDADAALKQYLAAGKKYHVLDSYAKFKTITPGFGRLGQLAGIDFIQTKTVTRSQLKLYPVKGTDYTVVSGLKSEIDLSAENSSITSKPTITSKYPEQVQIALVSANPTTSRVLSKWKIKDGTEEKEYDAIVQSNALGGAKIIYLAFPIEKSELKWLLEEVTKYLAWC